MGYSVEPRGFWEIAIGKINLENMPHKIQKTSTRTMDTYLDLSSTSQSLSKP